MSDRDERIRTLLSLRMEKADNRNALCDKSKVVMSFLSVPVVLMLINLYVEIRFHLLIENELILVIINAVPVLLIYILINLSVIINEMEAQLVAINIHMYKDLDYSYGEYKHSTDITRPVGKFGKFTVALTQTAICCIVLAIYSNYLTPRLSKEPNFMYGLITCLFVVALVVYIVFLIRKEGYVKECTVSYLEILRNQDLHHRYPELSRRTER